MEAPEGQWVTHAPRHGGEREHGGWRKDQSVRDAGPRRASARLLGSLCSTPAARAARGSNGALGQGCGCGASPRFALGLAARTTGAKLERLQWLVAFNTFPSRQNTSLLLLISKCRSHRGLESTENPQEVSLWFWKSHILKRTLFF